MKLAYIIQCAALAAMVAHADEAAIAPKCLYSVSETSQETKVKPEKVVTISTGGAVSVAGSNAEYPCVDFVPANGVWDLSPWGHIETQVKNTSEMPIAVNMRVDQTEPFQSNTEIAYLKPGESRTLKVIFGYQYGFKPGPKLDPAKIKLVKLFVGGKSDKTRTFTFTDIFANGPAGEKPPLNPNHVVTVPENGVMVGQLEPRLVAQGEGRCQKHLWHRNRPAHEDRRRRGDRDGRNADSTRKDRRYRKDFLRSEKLVREGRTGHVARMHI